MPKTLSLLLLLFSALLLAAVNRAASQTTATAAQNDTRLFTATFYIYYYDDYASNQTAAADAILTAAAPLLADRIGAFLVPSQPLAVQEDNGAPPIAVAACAPGSSFLNGTACAACDGCAGRYRLAWCAGRSDTVCVGACPAGSYAHHGGAPVYSLGGCTWCGAGRYAATEGQTACDACPSSSFSAGVGATACEACPPGTTGGADSCVQVSRCCRCRVSRSIC